MTKEQEEKMYWAIHKAVHAAIIAVGGIEGLRKCSFFPSSEKR